jgi:hypothetical protein
VPHKAQTDRFNQNSLKIAGIGQPLGPFYRYGILAILLILVFAEHKYGFVFFRSVLVWLGSRVTPSGFSNEGYGYGSKICLMGVNLLVIPVATYYIYLSFSKARMAFFVLCGTYVITALFFVTVRIGHIYALNDVLRNFLDSVIQGFLFFIIPALSLLPQPEKK